MKNLNEIDRPALERLEQALQAKNQGNLLLAESILTKLLESYPNMAVAYNNLGAIYFAQQEWKKALAAYQAAITNQADYVDAYYNLGLAYKKLSKHEAAVLSFSSLLKISAEHVGAHFQLGSLLMREHKYAEAMGHFETVLAEYPQHTESSINLANCHLKLGQLEKARSSYLVALSVEAHDSVLLFNLGVVSYQLGELAAAIDYYLRALSVKPDYFEAHNNLGACYLARQQRELALQQFSLAARIQPDNEALKYTIDFLSQSAISTSPPISYVSTLFDAYADHYDAHMSESLEYRVPQLFYEILQKSGQLAEQKKEVLDLGCGTGLCAEKLKSFAHKLHGVDVSAKMLAKARKKDIYDELSCSGIEDFLEKSRTRFQWVIAGDVLEYQGDLQELFRLVADSLDHGGLFLFNTEISQHAPYEQQPSGRFAHNCTYINDMAKKNHFTSLALEIHAMRQQAGEVVMGHLCLLKRD